MYTPDLSAVRFFGPPSPFAAGWRHALVADGYVPTSAVNELQLAAHLSRWLQDRDLSARDLTEPVIEDSLAERRATYTGQISLEALGPFLDYLRSLGAVPAPEPDVPSASQKILLAEYQNYLQVRRGLTAPVISAYGRWIGPFLDYLQIVGCRAQDDEVTGVIAEYLASRTSNAPAAGTATPRTSKPASYSPAPLKQQREHPPQRAIHHEPREPRRAGTPLTSHS